MELLKVELLNKDKKGVLNLGKVSNLKHDVAKTLVLHARAIVEKNHKPEVLNLTFVATHGYSFERENTFYMVSDIKVFTMCPDDGVESFVLDHSYVSQAVKDDIKKELSSQAISFFVKNNLHQKDATRYQLFIHKLKSLFNRSPKSNVSN